MRRSSMGMSDVVMNESVVRCVCEIFYVILDGDE